MKAEILSIGTELLLGEITDTNSRDLSYELSQIGMDVYHKETVGDNKQRIIRSLAAAFERSDIVITTGGLGPTQDDLTKEAAAEFLGREMDEDAATVKKLEEYFHPRGIKVNEGNRRQAYFPRGSRILENENGTAPAMMVHFDGEDKAKLSPPFAKDRYLFVLPGPPREMGPIFEKSVLPYLKGLTGKVFVSKTFCFSGIGEGQMEEKILDLIKKQTNPTIAPYAKAKGLTLRVTASGKDEEEAKKTLFPVSEEIKNRLSEYIFAEEEIGIEELIAKRLTEKGLSLAVAESCTGGLLCGRIVDVPGISKVFKEGFITYSNEAKKRALGVSAKTLQDFGAVSEETAKEMAKGAAERAGADVGLSVTGIAGPGGGTEEKPVGQVYIGVFGKGEAEAKKVFIKGPREYVRRRSVLEALHFLREYLEK